VLPAAGEEMPTKYEWTAAEEPLYAWWESSGYFHPKSEAQCAADGSDPEDTFTISMPPPNVTGALHMGHVMFVALQDILTRFNRMRGKRTLWLPGTDHAGIATQMLVDRALKAQGIEKADIGREAFIEKVWEWKGAKGGYMRTLTCASRRHARATPAR
jgi:valyl-tRNA synthetase